MALSIKNDKADRLARELAEATGETITDAIVEALRERLARERAKRGPGVAGRLRRLAQDVAALPVVDRRPIDEIIGYDDRGLPG